MNAEQNSELWATLKAQHPQAFPLDAILIRPLKVGVHTDIRAAHPDADPRAVRIALGKWCGRRAYKWALIRHGARIDLHGEPAGEVTPEQQAHAMEQLQALAEKRKRRQSAQRPKPKPLARPTKPVAACSAPAPANHSTLRPGEAAHATEARPHA